MTFTVVAIERRLGAWVSLERATAIASRWRALGLHGVEVTTRSMTEAEARIEALRRFGPCGRAMREDFTSGPCVVGTIGALPADVRYGVGVTWEDAFDDAEKRKERKDDAAEYEEVRR